MVDRLIRNQSLLSAGGGWGVSGLMEGEEENLRGMWPLGEEMVRRGGLLEEREGGSGRIGGTEKEEEKGRLEGRAEEKRNREKGRNW